MSFMIGLDEEKYGNDYEKGIEALYGLLKAEIDALRNIGVTALSIVPNFEENYYLPTPGTIKAPRSFISVPEDIETLFTLIAPLCENDGLGCQLIRLYLGSEAIRIDWQGRI